MRIVLIDYGMGNLRSLIGALQHLGYDDVVVSNDKKIIETADRLILPGVGNFGAAIVNIKSLQLDLILKESASERKTPMLGICLGMQLLGMSSTETGYHQGLGHFNGSVEIFDTTDLAVPHVGFNQVEHAADMRLFRDISSNSDFYFTHSYKMRSVENNLLSWTDYGGHFICGFERDNVAGVQFHPELSQINGLKLIKNFIELF